MPILSWLSRNRAVSKPPESRQGGLLPEERIPMAARWMIPGPDGKTLRDRVLVELRAGRPPRDAEGRPTRDLRAIPLAGEDLSGLDLSDLDLTGADLSGANLRNARLLRTDLRHAVLMGAVLEGAEFMGADLSGANLNDCRAARAGFGRVHASGASFFNAHLQSTTFTDAALAGADFRAAQMRGARIRKADLQGADFSRADLREADLGLSRVAHAVFDRADLRAARLRALQGFRKASWIGVDLRDVNFTGAYMLRRHVVDENYLFEFRTRNRWTALIYWVWWITSDCGRSLWRWAGWNLALIAGFALLYERAGIVSDVPQTELTSLYFSVVTFTTLGYGDVVPSTAGAQVLAMIQVILGYLGLGGLLAILGNKMARRAD